MSNWRVYSESQDEELQPELELDFSLSQLRIVLFYHLVMSVHKKKLDFFGRQNNLVWNSGNTETFNKMLVHW